MAKAKVISLEEKRKAKELLERKARIKRIIKYAEKLDW